MRSICEKRLDERNGNKGNVEHHSNKEEEANNKEKTLKEQI